MKISKLIVLGIMLSVALPAVAAPAKNPHNRKKPRKQVVVKPTEPVKPALKIAEDDPTKSWQAYSFP